MINLKLFFKSTGSIKELPREDTITCIEVYKHKSIIRYISHIYVHYITLYDNITL